VGTETHASLQLRGDTIGRPRVGQQSLNLALSRSAAALLQRAVLSSVWEAQRQRSIALEKKRFVCVLVSYTSRT